MSSSTASTSTDLVPKRSSFSLENPLFKKSLSSKMDYLYEINYLKEDEKIEESRLPLLNPYSAFNKRNQSNLLVKSLKAIYQKKSLVPKEYVSASSMSRCPVFSTQQEQFVTLEIPAEFPSIWKKEGYTHIHFGAIRFAITYHGRKGLPVVSKLSLLDSRYEEYQHALIATMESTLDSGTVCVTVYPNFNVSLDDPHLLDMFKIQVHIIGAKHVDDDVIEATIHYQMSYRLQDHAFDMKIPGGGDALILVADDQKNVTCTKVPRKCTRQELIQVIPDTWITNYENLHRSRRPIESNEATIRRRNDGTVGISFNHAHLKRSEFLPSINMVEEAPERSEEHVTEIFDYEEVEEEPIFLGYGRTGMGELIKQFDQDGKPVYWFKDPISNHCFFDVCERDCRQCYPVEKIQKPRCKPLKKKDHRNFDDDDDFPPLASPSPLPKKKPLRCYEQSIKWLKKHEKVPVQPFIPIQQQPVPAMVISERYEDDFPPLESFHKGSSMHTPKIPAPNERLPTGQLREQPSIEQTLNWQTENALAQNRTLRSISSNLVELSHKSGEYYSKIDSRIQMLEKRLEQIPFERPSYGQSLQAHFQYQANETASIKSMIEQLKSEIKPKQPYQPNFFEPTPVYTSIPFPAPLYQTSSLTSPSYQSGNPMFPPTDSLILEEYHRRSKPRQRPPQLSQPKPPQPFQPLQSSQANSTPSQAQDFQSMFPGASTAWRQVRSPLHPLHQQVFRPLAISEPTTVPVEPSQQKDLYPSTHTNQLMLHETITDKDLFESVIKGSNPPEENQPVLETYTTGEVSDKDCQSEFEVTITEEESSENYSDDHSDHSDNDSEYHAFMANPAESAASGYTTQQPADQPMGQTEEEYFGLENATEMVVHKGVNYQFFTIDDLPPEKWAEKFAEFHTWMTTRNLVERDTFKILMEFTAKFTGILKDWWTKADGPFKMMFLGLPLQEAIARLYFIFLGKYEDEVEQKRTEFFRMKCLSYKKEHLEEHFKRMTKVFYFLGFDNNLKQAFVSSLPPMLADSTDQLIKKTYGSITHLSTGQIRQAIFESLEGICQIHQKFQTLKKHESILTKACQKPNLIIGSSCNGICGDKPKRRRFTRFKRNFQRRIGWKPRRRYFRKSSNQKPQQKRRGNKASNKCFVCGKPGHYAKDCPDKKAAKMISEIMSLIDDDISEEELDGYLSAEDEPSTETIFSIEDEVPEEDFISYNFGAKGEHEEGDFKAPHIKVQIKHQSYEPFEAIALVDTGAQFSMMNPKLLPAKAWKPSQKRLTSASGDDFDAGLETKEPLEVTILPNCKIQIHVLGCGLPRRDLLLGFDAFKKMNLLVQSQGISKGPYFKPYEEECRMWQLNFMESVTQIKQQLVERLCANSHDEFMRKHSRPLWTREEFFIELPFKEGKVINPTKASHSGMNPQHLKMAVQECKELLKLGLITESKSSWACEAFYVNKRAEQARGKLRLVINYQPLNQCLKDVKFPLPRRSMMFSHLPGAQWFSKFDLKAGFWQIGIKPEERYKTAFCIPDYHLEWTVMPFGLKIAPSEFQKVMTKIFEPILGRALIYIDDILLFSKTMEEHIQLLREFMEICQEYGVMLSEKKMILAQQKIQFLGMEIDKGRFQPGKHIAQELFKFPDENLTKQQIQQFLGIINYIRDFVPNIAPHISTLTKMLKKTPPKWSKEQTRSVQWMKEHTKDLPPLHIPTGEGLRILQTDASDYYWGAILLQEVDGKRLVCGYASGRFKDGELHYHSTYKEILAVKNGIKKFNFHLIGYKFLIELDMSAFPRMLQFKRKEIPQAQALRWQQWFSRYNYDVHHIAGKKNVVADFLSRPQQVPQLQFQIQEKSQFIEVFMFHEEGSSSSQPSSNSNADFPPDIDTNEFPWSHEYLEERRTDWEVRLFRYYGGHMLQPYGIHPKYPFAQIFIAQVQDWPEELNWIFWYLCHEYHILMEFHKPSLRKELDLSVEKDLIKFLTWFNPLKYWKRLCLDGPEFFIIHFHRKVTARVSRFLEGYAKPFMKVYEQHMESISVREEDYPEMQRYIFAQNKVIPKEIWPREGIQPDVRQDDEMYYERIKSASSQYYYELSQARKEENWAQDPWSFEDMDTILKEVDKIEEAYAQKAQKAQKKRPKHKSQWNKEVWRTKRKQFGFDRHDWVNYMGYSSYSNYSTESDTASDEDSVMDLQFHGEWITMKMGQSDWNPQDWKGKRFMNQG